jgi:hypothetical protein
MPERASAQTWVEVHRLVLAPGERAPQTPDDTRQMPLELKVKGFLTHDATIGEEVDIITPAGRTLSGTLIAINPAYTHMFGVPIPELSCIGGEVRAILKDRGKAP